MCAHLKSMLVRGEQGTTPERTRGVGATQSLPSCTRHETTRSLSETVCRGRQYTSRVRLPTGELGHAHKSHNCTPRLETSRTSTFVHDERDACNGTCAGTATPIGRPGCRVEKGRMRRNEPHMSCIASCNAMGHQPASNWQLHPSHVQHGTPDTRPTYASTHNFSLPKVST